MVRGYNKDGTPSEESIQETILDWAAWNSGRLGIKFWRMRPSQYIRAQGRNVGFKLHPSEIGMADIMGTAFGWAVAVEVKSSTGVVSDNQKTWRDDLLRCSRTKYWVPRSLEEFIDLLQELDDVDPMNPLNYVSIKPRGKR